MGLKLALLRYWGRISTWTFWGGSRTAPTHASNNLDLSIRSLGLSKYHERGVVREYGYAPVNLMGAEVLTFLHAQTRE
jgi:hypothetical protein